MTPTRLPLVVLPLLAACGADVGPEPFAGRFVGHKNGTTSNLELRRDGADLHGQVVVGGQAIQLAGEVEDAVAAGQLTAMGQVNEFRAVATLDGLQMTLYGRDALSGRTIEETITFRRQDDRGSTGERTTRGEATTRDAALVGSWTRIESFGGGYDDFTGALEEFLVLRADGTMTTGTGAFYAGGSAGSLGSEGGEFQDAFWRSEGKVVQVGDGAGNWQPFARFYVEGNKLMFTFGDGSRQVWYRAG